MNFGVISTWLNKYTVPYSLILTRWGLCFNFNLVASSELLNLNETSSNFHYTADNNVLAYIPSLDSNSLELNETVPWIASNSRRYLLIYFDDKKYRKDNPFVTVQGFHLIFHSNFELPFEEERNHVLIGARRFVTISINPIVYEADESLEELGKNE